jgi:hypothetical protein
MTTKLKMTFHPGIQGCEDWPVGGFCYSDTDHEGRHAGGVDQYVVIRMNEAMCILPIVRGQKTDDAWGWNGSVEKPTLKPSVLHQPSPATLPWHGFVIDGELVTA